MNKDSEHVVKVAFDHTSMRRLEACAKWRGISIEELIHAYVEDWIDIDYPESHGRHTRRGIYRDGPIGLCEKTRQTTSGNWEAEFLAKGL